LPELTAILLAEQQRDALLKGERSAAVRLVNAYGTLYKRLQSQLDALTAELDVLAAKGEVSRWRAMRLDTLKRLKSQVLDEVDRYGVLVEDAVDQGARNAITVAGQNGYHLVQAALPGVRELDAVIMGSWQSLDPEAIYAGLGFMDDSGPIKSYLRDQFGKEIAQGVEDALIESIGLGYNPRKLATTFTRQFGMGLVSALRTARTTQLYAYREATRQHYMANEKIVPQWRWRSARDVRTCMSCAAMDGTLHDAKELLNDHWNGRCVAIPVPITYQMLGLGVADTPSSDQWLGSLSVEDQKRMLGKRFDTWRSGELRFSETAQDWFRRQSKDVQIAMMGPGKHKAFESGQFDLSALTMQVDDPVWGQMRVETPLKRLVGEEVAA
jgi:SPP1 gp7 family putative phage head morphogenesis protein